VWGGAETMRAQLPIHFQINYSKPTKKIFFFNFALLITRWIKQQFKNMFFLILITFSYEVLSRVMSNLAIKRENILVSK
jgi:hypothetical protein